MVANRLTEIIQATHNGVNHAIFLNLSHKTHSQKFNINSISYTLVQFFLLFPIIFRHFLKKYYTKIILATTIGQIIQFNTYILNFTVNFIVSLFNL